jgi:hypothetical protein
MRAVKDNIGKPIKTYAELEEVIESRKWICFISNYGANNAYGSVIIANWQYRLVINLLKTGRLFHYKHKTK